MKTLAEERIETVLNLNGIAVENIEFGFVGDFCVEILFKCNDFEETLVPSDLIDGYILSCTKTSFGATFRLEMEYVNS